MSYTNEGGTDSKGTAAPAAGSKLTGARFSATRRAAVKPVELSDPTRRAPTRARARARGVASDGVASDGVVRAGAGILLADLEDTARARGWELRQHPSTRRTATLGGFVAGGSTGVGALMHGGLAEDGAVLGLRVVTAEPTPRVLELTGRDVFPVVHAYGTNGVITEVEVPLARAQPWWDCVASFPRLANAAKFALELGEAPAIVAREVSVHQAPTFATLLSHTPLGTRLGEIRVEGTSERKSAESHADRHVVLAQVSGPGRGPLERLATDNGGAMCFDKAL